MAILGSTDLGDGRCYLTVDHDPTSVSTDCLAGSLIYSTTTTTLYEKTSDGDNTDVAVKDDSTDPRTDNDAIHDNVDGEIAAVALKATPVSADVLLIEDSAATNAKKRITVGSLPSGGQTVYDAIVPTDYSLPSAAFTAGAKSVFVRSGTYVETANIVIPDGGRLVGEDGLVIIDLSGGYSITADGNGGTTEAVGTIAFTTDSTAVTGTGTTFTNLSGGDYIALGATMYEIASITDATNLVLVDAYEGNSRTGFPMFGTSMFNRVSIEGVRITGATGTGLLLRALRESHVSRVVVDDCLDNILVEDCGDITLFAVTSFNGTNDGIDITDSRTVLIAESHFSNNGANGLQVNGASLVVKCNNVECNVNGADGFTVTGTSTDCTFDGCGAKNNDLKGINTEPTTTRTVIDGNTIQFNGTVGVDFDGDQNVITNSQIGNNGTIGVQAGDNGVISGNHIHDNGTEGISLNGDTNCVIVGNHLDGNTGDGIGSATSADCVIVGNQIVNNGAWGIDLAATSGGCTIADNEIAGNTSGAINDLASDTIYGISAAGVAAQGDILYRSATAWTRLAAGTSGQFLQTQGAAANPTWATIALAAMAAVQARRTTSYTLTGAFADITFDATDVENDTAVVEHDNVATEQIDIKETGEYLISYQTTWQPAATNPNTCSLRVYKNGTTLVNGSDMSDASSGDNNDHPMAKAFIATLTAGDEISLQAQVSTVEGVLAAGTILAVVRLKAPKGDTGAQGPGGTDDDAIHDNVAGEINAITEKTTPVSADLLLIEDSAASNAKKKVQVGNLPGGGTARDTCRFVVNGKPAATTKVDGAWIAPGAGTFKRITLYRRTAGSSGSTIVDVNKNGTTLYTTQGNRPTVTQAGGNDQIDATTDFNVTTFAQNDRIEVDIDQVEAGNPQDVSVIIEVEYT